LPVGNGAVNNRAYSRLTYRIAFRRAPPYVDISTGVSVSVSVSDSDSDSDSDSVSVSVSVRDGARDSDAYGEACV
jgi:hypothetical protein